MFVLAELSLFIGVTIFSFRYLAYPLYKEGYRALSISIMWIVLCISTWIMSEIVEHIIKEQLL